MRTPIAILALALFAATAGAGGLEVGKAGGDFSLPGEGGAVSLQGLLDQEDTTAVVVAVTSYTCPYALRAAPGFKAFADEQGEKGVKCVALYPNRHETADGIRSHASKSEVSHLVVRDPAGEAARALGAEVTPTFYLFDKTGILRYRGKFAGLGAAAASVLAGDEVATKNTAATGCTIKWSDADVPDVPAEPTREAPVRESPREGQPPRRPAPELSEAASTWLGSLLTALASDDPIVRRSAANGIAAMGPSALPHLERARKSAEGNLAGDLDRIIARLSAPRRRPGGNRNRPGGGGQRGSFLDMQRRVIEQNLDLSEEQLAELDKALAPLKEREKEMAVLREAGDMEGFREGIRALFEDARVAIEQVLTPEQIEKWEQMRRERGRGFRRGGRGGGERREDR